MKIRKWLTGFSAFAVTAVVCAVGAGAESYGDYYYNVLDDGTVEITSYYGETETLDIPSQIDGKAVTKIASGAFSCASISYVTLPDSITSIDDYAFESSDIVSITLSENVTNINGTVFNNCNKLTSINIADGSKNYSSADGVLFNKSKTELVCYPAGKTDNRYNIPDSVAVICNNAFYDCDNITAVEIPNSVTTIGWEAFSRCDRLADITIPDSVNYIDGWVFTNCPSLAEIKVSADNEQYTSANGVLFNKDMTRLMCYPKGKTDTSYDIPDGTAVIEGAAFLNCSNITNVTMPDSVTDIEYMAFDKCENLSQINLSNGLTVLRSEIFSRCSSLKSIVIPDSVTSIADYTFDNCTALTNVTLPLELSSVGEYTFEGCTALKTITVPASVGEIGKKAFGYKDYSSLIDGFTLNCYSGTAAEQYAKNNGLTYNVLDCDEHQYNPIILREPTCTETGCERFVCAGCGRAYLGEISAKGHIEVIDKGTPATCTQPGISDGSHCSVCNETIVEQEIIDAFGHTDVIDEAVEPTCTSTGLTEGLHCAVCDAVIIEQSVLPMINHVKAVDFAVLPTCTETGLTEGIHCTVCNTIIKKQEVIPANGHTIVTDEGYEPTCTETGLTEGSHCSVCNEIITAQEEIAAKGHTIVTIAASEPTCGKPGNTGRTCCIECGITFKDYEVIPATENHSFGEWELNDEPTCTEFGIESRICSVCGKLERREIKALGHKYVNTVVKPTYTAQGYTLHKCSVCGASYKDNYTAKLTVANMSGYKVKSKTSTSVTLQWNKNTTATGYELQKWDGKKWVALTKITSNATTTYTVKSLKASTTYKYRIRAYKTVGKNTYYSGYTELSVNTNPSGMSGYKVKSKTSTSVTLQWNKNTTATGYELQKWDGKKWVALTKITSNATTTYTVKSLKASTTYKYRIRAYKTIGKATQYSGYTELSVNTNPSGMSGFKVKSTAKTSVTLQWNKNTTATGYELQKWDGKKWVTLTKITKNSTTTYTVKSLKANTSYKYRIRAYKTIGKATQYSGYSATVTAKTKK